MTVLAKRWTFTSRFKKKKGQGRFLERLNQARSYFPELEELTVKVGTTVNVDGKADSINHAIYFKSRNVSFYVMGHELTHLLQGSGKVPKGERSCDIYTLAREVKFCDEAPSYLKIPKRMLDDNGFIQERYRILVHYTAKRAINMRGSGKRRYISLFEKELEEGAIKENDSYAQTKLEDFISRNYNIKMDNF